MESENGMHWGAKWPGTSRKQQVGNLAGGERVEGCEQDEEAQDVGSGPGRGAWVPNKGAPRPTSTNAHPTAILEGG